jgi:hypothetical protein
MTLNKLQFWIEKVPWYIFAAITLLFVYKLYLNVDSFPLVIVNLVGISCFTYLAAHNSILQPGGRS